MKEFFEFEQVDTSTTHPHLSMHHTQQVSSLVGMHFQCLFNNLWVLKIT
jgi:hypothetical protein